MSTSGRRARTPRLLAPKRTVFEVQDGVPRACASLRREALAVRSVETNAGTVMTTDKKRHRPQAARETPLTTQITWRGETCHAAFANTHESEFALVRTDHPNGSRCCQGPGAKWALTARYATRLRHSGILWSSTMRSVPYERRQATVLRTIFSALSRFRSRLRTNLRIAFVEQ